MSGDPFSPAGFEATGHGPLYLQFQRRIADAIASGRLAPGDSLPPEREMASMTGLSRVTVRRAVQELVASGQLVQRQGSGTFVARKVERLEQALSLLTSFTEDMARRGRSVESRWIGRGLFAPTPEEVMALGLGSADRVARLERVRLSDGVPLAIERASLSQHVLPRPEAVERSLYDVLDARGLRPVRAVQRISATNLGPGDAGLLQVAPGVAGLRIERISYLPSGQVIEFTRSLYRGDAYDFAVELKSAAQPDRRPE
ncbi:GntR family transcriptional regulator [Paracoccus shandongensis]|uniref:GntR family transcriptional regulator n=1 Tax=Paracoccus shandongensis TaxID=2816048 RepID=UPI001A907D3A|nr:GntR family transcriptional regulator [Paracoccus shandongensis]